MKKTLYILRLVLVVLLPLLMALAPAKAQTNVYQGDTKTLSVVPQPGDTYDWELYSDLTVNFAVTPGNAPAASAVFAGGNTGPNVDVQWLATGIYFFKVTARDAIGCAMNFKIGMIKVMARELQAVITADATQIGGCFDVLLDGSKSIGNNLHYSWKSLDSGGLITNMIGVTTKFQLSPSYTGPLPAEFKVQLIVTDDKDNAKDVIISIRVDSKPIAKIYTTGISEADGSMIVDAKTSMGKALTYKWAKTTTGEIIGSDSGITAKLFGAGKYKLTVVDSYGCESFEYYDFPSDINQIIAVDDKGGRTSWARDTIMNVLANDYTAPNSKFVPGSVRIVKPAKKGNTKVNPDGSITYIPTDRRPGQDQFEYEVCNDLKFCDQATVTIDIFDSGIITSEGFSPNGDNINDVLEFVGLDKYPKSSLYIYTRSGQLVYETVDYLNNWDGRTIGSTATSQKLVPSGTYYYIIKLGGTNRSLKGFIYVGY